MTKREIRQRKLDGYYTPKHSPRITKRRAPKITKRVRVPKPVLAMAAASDTSPFKVERLKDGTTNYGVTVIKGWSLKRHLNAVEIGMAAYKYAGNLVAAHQADEQRRKDNLRSIIEAQRAKIEAEKA